MKSLKTFLEFKIIDFSFVEVSIFDIIRILILILLVSLFLNIVKKFIRRKEKENIIDKGKVKVLYQIIKYLIIIIALFIALDSLGVKISILLASSAALFVGIGLGIQQIFGDIMSGMILLFGGAVKIGDVIEVDKIVGKVTEVGIRTSRVVTIDDIDMIIPNSKLTSQNLVNWSYNNNLTRFSIKVSVKYGSDVEKVRRVLIESANTHPHVSKFKNPLVQFTDFGDHALCFELLFWSENMFRVEYVRSDLRFIIDKKFRENNIIIPFPQHDIHIINKPI